MDGEVDSTEGRESALALLNAQPAALQWEALGVLHGAVANEVFPKADVIAHALVKLAIEGHGPSIKLLIEILQDIAKNRTAIAVPIMRSLAEEWGAEPEWSGGCCIHCAKISGNHTAGG